MAQLLAVSNTSCQLKTLSVHYLTTPSEWQKTSAFWSYQNCASNPCTVFWPYFFWTSSEILSLTWLWTLFTGVLLTVQRMCNKNMLSQAHTACHFRDWFIAPILQGVRLLRPLAWQSPEPAFFPTNYRFDTSLKFQDHCFQLFAATRDVMCLFCSPTQATELALSSIPAFGTQLLAKKWYLKVHSQECRAGCQQLSEHKGGFPREENSPMCTQSQGLILIYPSSSQECKAQSRM